MIHTSSVSARGVVQFRVRQDTFFIDPQLFAVIIPCVSDGVLHDTSLLIPSRDLPAITTISSDRGDPGYQGSFRLDPMAERMRPFAVPTANLGATVLERLFPTLHS